MVFDTAQRQQVANDLKHYLAPLDIPNLVAQHTSPLFLLDVRIIKQRYSQIQQAFPGVRHYYAMKAFSHPAVLQALLECGAGLDVATPGEIAAAQAVGFDPEQLTHTHPIKKPQEIEIAIQAGIRRFVVDNPQELAKFKAYGNQVELMIRLSHSDPTASLNLAYKFGADQAVARALVKQALEQGNTIHGLCIHVGSQIHDPSAYTRALEQTISFIDELEASYSLHIRHIGIGGGFPVEYRQPVASIQDIAAAVMPIIESCGDRFEFSSEPGRYIAAPAMVALSSVVGTSQRHGEQWGYIDDGVYGAYANNIFEGIIPHVFVLKELRDPQANQVGNSLSTTLAGPTCDSVDIVVEHYPLPKLEIGDLLVSPMMGAYSNVLGTTFNSIPATKIVVIGQTVD